MRYITEYKEIMEKEKDEYENLIKDSTRLMTLLYNYEPDNEDKYLAKYINLLFGLRCAEVDYKELKKIYDDVYNNYEHGIEISSFKLQKKIKEYLGSIDSSLDYLHKFLAEFKNEKNNKFISFDRENFKFANDINDIRNEVLHEGVPTLLFDRQDYPAHVNTAGTFSVRYSIRVKVNSTGRVWELKELINHTYLSTKRKVQEITDESIKKLEK